MKNKKGNRNERQVENYNRDSDENEFIIIGRNPVREALQSDLQVEKILIQKDNSDYALAEITKTARENNLLVQSVERSRLEELSQGRPHQGVVALMAPFVYVDLASAVESVVEKEDAIFVLCDHITDPQNFGAIIRNAEVSGADAVVFPQRRSAGLSPAAMKASSGAAAYIDLVKVNNLSQTIETLKRDGFWIAGADMNGELFYKANLKGKIAIVLGSEGKGLSPKIKKLCDFLISIPVYGKVDSLNVSAAAAVLLTEAARQQHT